MCKRQFCNPMCLADKGAWEFDWKCEGAFAGCGDIKEPHKNALTAMFKAYGCVTSECCKDQSRLHEWISDNWFGDDFPNNIAPLKSCVFSDISLVGDPVSIADKRKQTCDDCKASLKAELKKGTCELYSITTGKAADTKPHKSAEAGLLQLRENEEQGPKKQEPKSGAPESGACKGGESSGWRGQEKTTPSDGTCKAKAACDGEGKTYTSAANGAKGCEKEPADVMCCSETKCDDGGQNVKGQPSQEGVCISNAACGKKGEKSTSDSIYSGTATGCRHLPDEIRCCSPKFEAAVALNLKDAAPLAAVPLIPLATYNPKPCAGKYGQCRPSDQDNKDKKDRAAVYLTQKDRCLNLAAELEATYGALIAEIPARACACLGCCIPEEPNGPEDCPWPQTFPLARRRRLLSKSWTLPFLK